MSKLKLKNVRIELPKDFNGNPTDSDMIEWIEYEIGMTSVISTANPLFEVDIKACSVWVGEMSVNGKLYTF